MKEEHAYDSKEVDLTPHSFERFLGLVDMDLHEAKGTCTLSNHVLQALPRFKVLLAGIKCINPSPSAQAKKKPAKKVAAAKPSSKSSKKRPAPTSAKLPAKKTAKKVAAKKTLADNKRKRGSGKGTGKGKQATLRDSMFTRPS